MNNFTFTYQRTKDDVLQQTVFHRMIKNRINFVGNFLFPFFGVVALIFSFTTTIEVWMYFAITYLILYPFITYFLIKFQVTRAYNDPNVEFDITTYIMSDKGINVASDKGEHLLEWEHVFQIYEVRKYFYIYIDRNYSLIINKEHIGSEKEESLKALFLEHASKSAIKFK